MVSPRIPKEKNLLERMLKAGMISESEYSFALETLDNKKGEL